MGVLWYSIGASRPYEMFAGCVELVGGILLFVPQTALLGGLVTLATTIQIFTLNMTYDVPVKLLSFHLILLSLFVLAPNARRLAHVVLLNRAAGPSTLPTPGRSRGSKRAFVLAQLLLGAWVLGTSAFGSAMAWYSFGGGAARPPLYGIWTVDQMTRDGVTLPPLLSDQERWRRVVIQAATSITFQQMNETLATFGVSIDTVGRILTVSKGSSDTSAVGRFAFNQPTSNQLVLDGEMNGHQLHLAMTLVDRHSFLLVNRGFNWVQELPFNR